MSVSYHVYALKKIEHKEEEEEYKRKQDQWICFKKGNFAGALRSHSPKNN